MRLGWGDDNLPFPTVPGHRINCTGREISYTKTPVSIHQQDILPEAFASSECKVEKTFGTAYEKVHAVDGSAFQNVGRFCMEAVR